MPFEGSTIYGILRTPEGPSPHPAVICVPGLDSTKEELRATEQLFLERGLATFSVDGPGQVSLVALEDGSRKVTRSTSRRSAPRWMNSSPPSRST